MQIKIKIGNFFFRGICAIGNCLPRVALAKRGKLPALRSFSEVGKIGNSYFGKPKQAGFVLLFTILVSSIILLIALGISGISYRETILTSEANGGAEAFFAADTVAECGLYLAIGNGISCLGATKTINDSGTSLDFPLFSNIDNKYCVAITQSGHSIESRGYNVDYNEVQSGNPRAVQRAIKVTYLTY